MPDGYPAVTAPLTSANRREKFMERVESKSSCGSIEQLGEVIFMQERCFYGFSTCGE
jgi:hypothetical protein